MAIEPFEHLLLGPGWSVCQQEQRGKRPKYWVSGNGALWLRKEPNPARPFEITIETSTLRLARALELNAPESCLCSWAEGNAAMSLRKGVLVKKFLNEDEELSLGSDLLSGYDSSYNRENHNHHTLPLIRSALSKLEEEREATLLKPFLEMVVFDAWIGNTDRHQENWGLIASRSAVRLAPIFDTAACLGTELLDPSVRSVRPKEYVGRCGSGFGNAGKKLALQEVVLEQLSKWPQWGCAFGLVERFRELFESEIASYFESIPQDWLPSDRRELAISLLEARLKWLEDKVR